MKKILIISHRSYGPLFAKKIAEDCPDTQVDFCGYEFSYRHIPNLQLVSTEMIISNVILYIKKVYKFYDFIISLDHLFAADPDYQKLKKSIDTPILCLDRICTHLEYSKLSCKQILNSLNIPNPDYEIIEENLWGIAQDLKKDKFKKNEFVLKLDSTWIGSGSQTRYANYDNYKDVIPHYRSRSISGPIFIEEKISGYEVSCHFLLNGKDWLYLGSARDYKRERDGDQGQNCSSMGCYSPGYIENQDVENKIFSYMDKILNYLISQGIEYKGIMYLGIMVSSDDVYILEINTRPGNPEFISIFNNLKSKNLLKNFWAAYSGEKFVEVEFDDKYSVVVNAIKDKWNNSIFYPISTVPTKYKFDDELFVIYHNSLTTQNYLFSILYQDDTLENAAEKIYQELNTLNTNTFYRKDIGYLQ
jgi:phosphoribosylamine---glycine ligase